jgi:protoporphyrinogen oxidase
MKIIIAGGGIAGLFAALVVKSLKPDALVTIIESEKKLGGLLAELTYEGVSFDTGVHTFYETGDPDVDNLLFSIVPTGGWNKLTGLSRDIGGIFQDGSLNLGNSYLNFLNLESDKLVSLQKAFLTNFDLSKHLDFQNAHSALESKFGSKLVDSGLSQFVMKFTGADPRTISPSVISILPLSRINLFSEEIHRARISDAEWNSRISYPDQRQLPESLIPMRSAYYPSNYGTNLYINALITKLESLGVIIETDTKIIGVSSSKVVTDKGDEIAFDQCFWAIHPLALARILGDADKVAPKMYSVPMRTAIVSYLVNKEPKMGDLYYAYDSTPSHITHRFSSPINFCSKSKVGNLFRFTNEVVFHQDMTEKEIMEKSSDELVEMGIFENRDIQACYVSRVPGGYPNLNAEASYALQEYLKESLKVLPNSVLPIGIMSEPELFFQNDVLMNVYNKVHKIFS